MTDPRRPPEAAAVALVMAAELLEADRLTAEAVLRSLGAAASAAAPASVDQIALAIADVSHWALRCRQIAGRLRELAGEPVAAGQDRGPEWASGQLQSLSLGPP